MDDISKYHPFLHNYFHFGANENNAIQFNFVWGKKKTKSF